GALQLEGAGPRDPAIAVVAPLRGRALQAVREEGMPQAGAVVFVSPRRAADMAPTVLAQLYGFSPAESRVALRIARGEPIPAVAAALGLSINTVKTHTRQIFDKTGVRRQAEFCGALAPLQLFSAADRETSSPA
ncbi:helix-turn-helix transcriptional regulator, partial [Reyranella sp. CPCC 100927]|uniref:helix-turn-helix transcriptional regulator n=1 Tax=Reyranella sp. CPCC 100927 TaxID=2599616 RepID=UPI0011B39F75